MIPLTQTFKDGHEEIVFVGVQHIVRASYVDKYKCTAVNMVSGGTLWVKESPQWIADSVQQEMRNVQ